MKQGTNEESKCWESDGCVEDDKKGMLAPQGSPDFKIMCDKPLGIDAS